MSTLHFSPLMSPSDSRFLRALIWARWSVFMGVWSRITTVPKRAVDHRSRKGSFVVLHPLSASLPFLDPSRKLK